VSSDNSTIVKKINDSIEIAAVNYSQNTALRAAISLLPGIGASIDLILSSGGQNIQTRRIYDTISNLEDEMAKIDETKIDKKFLDTEEFYDFMMRTFESCSKTRHNEKRILYCKILAHSVSIDNAAERSSTEDFIGFIDELSLQDLKVGMKIYEQQKNMPETFDIDSDENTELKFIVRSGWHEIRNLCKLNEVDFNIALGKLVRVGLIKETVGPYVGYTGGLYLITPTFKRLMNFIQLGTGMPLFNYHVSRTSST
jgi:hypothetical protein